MNPIFERILQGTHGNIELRRMVWIPKAGNGKGRYDPHSLERLFSREPREVESFLKNGPGDVFHGTATRKLDTETGTKDDVHEIVCFAVDVDFKVPRVSGLKEP